MKQTTNSAVNPLKDQIERWAYPMGTFNQPLFDTILKLLQERKEYARQYLRTGDSKLLQLVDICNNKIKALLAL
jgi:hypothetical protein